MNDKQARIAKKLKGKKNRKHGEESDAEEAALNAEAEASHNDDDLTRDELDATIEELRKQYHLAPNLTTKNIELRILNLFHAGKIAEGKHLLNSLPETKGGRKHRNAIVRAATKIMKSKGYTNDDIIDTDAKEHRPGKLTLSPSGKRKLHPEKYDGDTLRMEDEPDPRETAKTAKSAARQTVIQSIAKSLHESHYDGAAGLIKKVEDIKDDMLLKYITQEIEFCLKITSDPNEDKYMQDAAYNRMKELSEELGELNEKELIRKHSDWKRDFKLFRQEGPPGATNRAAMRARMDNKLSKMTKHELNAYVAKHMHDKPEEGKLDKGFLAFEEMSRKHPKTFKKTMRKTLGPAKYEELMANDEMLRMYEDARTRYFENHANSLARPDGKGDDLAKARKLRNKNFNSSVLPRFEEEAARIAESAGEMKKTDIMGKVRSLIESFGTDTITGNYSTLVDTWNEKFSGPTGIELEYVGEPFDHTYDKHMGNIKMHKVGEKDLYNALGTKNKVVKPSDFSVKNKKAAAATTPSTDTSLVYDIKKIYKIIETDLSIRLSKAGKTAIAAIIKHAVDTALGGANASQAGATPEAAGTTPEGIRSTKSHGFERLEATVSKIEAYLSSCGKGVSFTFNEDDRKKLLDVIQREFSGLTGTEMQQKLLDDKQKKIDAARRAAETRRYKKRLKDAGIMDRISALRNFI